MMGYMVKMCLVLIGMSAQDALAQNYPARPIRVINATSSGGGIDVFARLLIPGMAQALGQNVFVENRPGGGTNIAAEVAVNAPADGYTVLIVNQAHAVNVSLYRNLKYDLVRDFAAVTQLASSPQIVVVHPSFPVKSIGDLVKLAKAKPGAINYASAGMGTQTFLAAELFKIMAGVNLVEVRYRGGGNALTAVFTGEVPVYFVPLAAALPLIREGKLRALAVTTAKRLSALPGYPTVAESGYPGYDCGSWLGLAVPAKTPKDTIAKIHGAAVAALNRPDINKRMRDLSYITIGSQPEEFADYIKSEIERWRKIIRQTGITAD